jgi:transcriptional regulator with XRE-family HTH domain
VVIVVVEWTGLEARVLRKALRMTVLGFAQHLGVGSRTVSDWEAGGAEIVPTPAMQAVLDTALSRAADEAKIRFVELTSGNPAVRVSDSPGHNGNGDHTDRRQAGKTILMGGLAALFPREAVERIIHHGDRPVDSGLITAHEDFADVFAQQHSSTQHDVLFDQVAHHADKLLWLLDRPMATAQRRRLEALVVSTHAQAGLLAFNLADRAGARRYLALARDVADDAGDDTLRAQTLVTRRILYTSIESGGRGSASGRALETMRQAADLSRRADPDTRAYVHAWLGLELAAAEDERGFLTSYEVAERLAQHTGQGEGRGYLARRMLSWRLQPERAANKGIGLVRVGRADEAVDALTAMLGPAFTRVIALADIALARVLQGEPEQACQDLHHALDLAFDAGYAMGIERIRGVRARFPKPWNDLACVRELDERLRAAA